MGEHRSWNRMATKRCRANGIMDEFIVVDDDDDVIILDSAESSKSKAPGTSRTRDESIWKRVISLDDDEDDDDDDDDDEEEDTEYVPTATSSRNSLGDNLPSSAQGDDDDNDDCQFVQEKCAAFKFSKCNQTFSTAPSSGVRFGLGPESESEFSDSDCSDCEILEGSNGKVREQWEKAFLRKTRKPSKAGPSDETGPSDLPSCSNLRPAFEERIPKKSFEQDNRAKTSVDSKCFSNQDFAGPSSHEKEVEHERSDSPSPHFTSSEEWIHQNSFKEVEKQPERVQVPFETSQSTKVKRKENVACHQSYTEKDEDASPSHTSEGVVDATPVLNIHTGGARCEDGDTGIVESREVTIDPIPSTSGKQKDINGTEPAINIMLGRERMKETDEYKKAQEQEWESRQQQLQIQAEEAQRQRKRRKQETMRQLEMERRQKERIEEVRETQKKDEEIMNMKEKIRAEVTRSLTLLELKCTNMASLLRGLGIHVGGGPSPLPSEVHAAYKLALLKFHPDRASGGDIRQQVEAEEKFKLIARMKDKFKSAS